MHKPRTFLSIMMACVIGLTVSIPGTSLADSPRHNYCALNIETDAMSCFSTESELESMMSTSVPRVRLGTWFDRTNMDRRGGHLVFFASHGCSDTNNDVDHADSSLKGSDWNNRVSSLITASGCDFKLYDGIGFTGHRTSWIDSSANLGDYDMNNRASSYKIS
ncbi:hypothetical protein SAMN05661093_08741 [Kibdelosporangium aridum]|uniref:Peptidase inhibitor family I36 n=1 Tax=Kibdelosporangium aridum TaxID=2030 RepID=A0A1W2FS28_KIBAR|nr:hypothetical protein SAMN05661093_08741 [Kibdelosporangium aridum]